MRPRVEALQCSIVETGATCVVNASNESATLGGGVSRALLDECGDALQVEMHAKLERDFDGVLEEGDCMVTSAGASTEVHFVLHVPAVDYRLSKSRPGVCGIERTLTSAKRVQACTEAALRAASELGSAAPVTVAIPLLGAGAGGLSPAVACRAMIEGVRAFLRDVPTPPLDTILFAIPEPDRFELCAKLVHDAFG